MAYDYIQENYDDVSSIEEKLLLFNITKDSLESGAAAARKALTDVGVSEANGIIRIDTFRNTVGCRPGLGEWSAGAIATWHKESGLPIPDKDASSAPGWYVWAKKTGRWFETPIVGSIAVYGTQEYNYENDSITYNAHHLGLVIQVDDEENTVVTCENVNGEIAQAIADIDSVLGFITPSKTDIKKPEITYEEPIDDSKNDNLNETTEYTKQTTNKKKPITQVARFISDVVRKVLIKGDTQKNCANGTYNHAHQFVRALQGKEILPGRIYHAGGNAKQNGYHRELERLGYKRKDYGTISHKEMLRFLNDSNNWDIGDIAVYWTDNPYFSNCSCYQYGHTQIFTGGYQSNGQFKWATDNRNNYRTACVYSVKHKNTGKVYSNGNWRLLKFEAPDV